MLFCNHRNIVGLKHCAQAKTKDESQDEKGFQKKALLASIVVVFYDRLHSGTHKLTSRITVWFDFLREALLTFVGN